MSDQKMKKTSADRKAEKKAKKDRGDAKKQTKKRVKHDASDSGPFSLLADESTVNPALSSLFAAKSAPPEKAAQDLPSKPNKDIEVDGIATSSRQLEEEPELNGDDSVQRINGLSDFGGTSSPEPDNRIERKRKRKQPEEEVEDAYMRRLAQEEAKEAELLAKTNGSKRQKTIEDAAKPDLDGEDNDVTIHINEDGEDETAPSEQVLDDTSTPPPRHETEQTVDDELSKANRTVFLGNVSTAAISSKVARKNLITHLKSFFSTIAKPKDGEPKHAIESIRFRSTPYANSVPKKAAFATKQVMDATTKSTNAYAVYSTPALAREAAKHLNATVVLGRHLRVDSVAHPSKVDSKRCVFVGNLGFVDDESNIQAANEEEGKEKRKPSKTPADAEEGLWRTFGKCGTIESVRVVRDNITRVGKGIAYVQFDDANAVEAALLYNDKKFPPMLPRKLRVARAKAQKRNPKPGSSAPTSRSKTNGYQRKVTGQEASQMGRANKLFGRAGAAQMKHDFRGGRGESNGIKAPESFVFEGRRASSKSGKSGLKLGGRGKKSGKPTGRSAKRGAAFKATKKAKAR